MDASVKERIEQIIVAHLGVEADQVKTSASLTEDLGADSLDAMDLLMAINEEFHTKISAQALEPVETVADLTALVESELSKQ